MNKRQRLIDLIKLEGIESRIDFFELEVKLDTGLILSLYYDQQIDFLN